MDTSKVNRLEVIDHRKCLDCNGDGHTKDAICEKCNGMGIRGGRSVIVAGPAYGDEDNAVVFLQLQDADRTLKVFIQDK